MKNSRYLLLLIISEVVAAFVILVVHGIALPPVLVPSFVLPWVGFGVLRVWLECAALTMFWVIFLRFGLLPVLLRETRSEEAKFPDLRGAVSISTVWLIVIATAFLLLHPVAVSSQAKVERSSAYARDMLAAALRLEEAGDFFRAMEVAELAMDTAPDFPEGEAVRERLFHRVSQLPAPEMASEVGAQPGRPMQQSFGEILSRAIAYLDEEDYFSALYYADQALQVSGMEREPRALSIRETARRRIQAAELSGTDVATQQRFVAKRRGIAALEEGRYVEAYYLFEALSQEDPSDPDILEWFPRIRESLRQVTFFQEDAIAGLDQWSRETLVAWQELRSEGQFVWIYSASAASRHFEVPELDETEEDVSGITNYYFEGIEIAVLDAETGDLLARGQAPFGKAVLLPNEDSMQWYLLTQAIPQGAPGENTSLEWSALDQTIRASQDAVFWEWGLVPLPAEPELILESSGLGGGTGGINTGRLFTSIRDFASLGYAVESLETELASRILRPLGDFVLLALFLGGAWGSRIRRAGPNLILAFAMLPVLLLVIYAFYSGFQWVLKLLAAWAVMSFGFSLALTILLIFGLIALVLGMVTVSVRHAER